MSQLLLEYWKPVAGYEGVYEISNMGNVRSLGRYIRFDKLTYMHTRMLRPYVANTGYPMVGLTKNKVMKYWALHRVVGETFLGPLPEGLQTCHNDGNRRNPRLSNLRYDTPSGNYRDMVKHGNFRPVRGEKHQNATLTDVQVEEIRRTPGKQRDIAARYGVSQSTVWRILHRITRTTDGSANA